MLDPQWLLFVPSFYGFILNWGPIIWGLLGLLAGGILGLLGDLFISRLGFKNGRPVLKAKLAPGVNNAPQFA